MKLCYWRSVRDAACWVGHVLDGRSKSRPDYCITFYSIHSKVVEAMSRALASSSGVGAITMAVTVTVVVMISWGYLVG